MDVPRTTSTCAAAPVPAVAAGPPPVWDTDAVTRAPGRHRREPEPAPAVPRRGGTHAAARARRARRPRYTAATVAIVVAVVGIGGGVLSDRSTGSPGDDSAAPTSTLPGITVSPSGTPSTTAAQQDPDEPMETGKPDKPDTPEKLEIPQSGPGTFVAAKAEGEPLPGAMTYTLEVERGLPFDPDETASIVEGILDDARSWRGVNGQRFSLVARDADMRILIATPDTTDELCYPLDTNGQVSCRQGGSVILNADRWGFGVPHFDGNLVKYRRYVVNHEVGHMLGHGHEYCGGEGQPAPVMMQQTYGLDGCTPNPWPTVN